MTPNEPYDPAQNESAQQGAKTGEAVGVLGWRFVSDVENPVGGAREINLSTDCTPIKTITIVVNSGSRPYIFFGHPVGGYPINFQYPTVPIGTTYTAVDVDYGINLDRGDGWQVGQVGFFNTGTSTTEA